MTESVNVSGRRMRSIDELVAAARAEAEREPFPIDREVYEKAKKDPIQPILYGGSLDAPYASPLLS